MKILAVTQKGTNKVENEDRIVIGKSIIAEGYFQTNISSGVVAIADGVGGNSAGAVASHFVAQQLTNKNAISQDCLIQINNDMLQLSCTCEDYSNMATTLSCLWLDSNKKDIYSVGNTRIYTLQGHKYLKQLTVDDTTLNHLISTGRLSVLDIESFDRKNEITACFGGGSTHYLKLKHDTIASNASAFLLTSDGIHDYVSIDQMEDIIERHGFSFKSCEELLSSARNAGSSDDVSIILAEE